MSQFDDSEDPLGGATLTPSPELDQTGVAPEPPMMPPAPMPDVSPIVASMPRLPAPAPIQPPPRPMDDPRQKLLALFTTMFALGAGPRSGAAAGALHGLNVGQQALQDDQLQRWKFNAAQQAAQAKVIEQKQAQLDAQRTVILQRGIQGFAQAATQATTKEEYDRQAENWGNLLASQGYRITPNWLRSQIPYTPQTQSVVAAKALKNWMSSDYNKNILATHPEIAMKSPISIDLGDGNGPRDYPLPVVAKWAGQPFAEDPITHQPILMPKGATTASSDFGIRRADMIQQWSAEHSGRQPDAAALVEIDNKLKEKPPESALDIALKQSLIDERSAKRGEANKPLGVEDDTQTTASGRRYLDISQYQTPVARERAKEEAKQKGITAVNKEVADSLRAADNAKSNLASLMSQLEPYLPRDPQGRLLGGPKNTLEKIFQTNPVLGAYGAWRTAAIQAVQALAEKGMGLRLNRAEIDLMLQNDIPKITDDVPTAKQRIANLTTLLENKEKSMLVRDRSVAPTTPSNDLESAKDKLKNRGGSD